MRCTRSRPAWSAPDTAATGIIFAALLGSLGMSLAMPFIFVMPRSLLDMALFVTLGLLGGLDTTW